MTYLAHILGPDATITPRRQALIDLEALRKADRAARTPRTRRAPADIATINRITSENQRTIVGITHLG